MLIEIAWEKTAGLPALINIHSRYFLLLAFFIFEITIYLFYLVLEPFFIVGESLSGFITVDIESR